MAKEYDALLPRTQTDSEEEIHEENVEDQSKQFKEQIIKDLVDEVLLWPLFEDISEQPPDTAVIEDVKLPQAYEQLHVEDEKLPQVYFEINNTCIADLPHERLSNDKSQNEERLPIAYSSPLQCYSDEACAPTSYMVKNLKDHSCLQHELSCDSLILMSFPGHICNIFDETLVWLMTKHRGKGSIVNEELRYLHWLYHFT